MTSKTHSKRRPITDAMKLAVLRQYGATVQCVECGRGKERSAPWYLGNIRYDHRLALVDGGAHTVENLQPLCVDHHAIKSAHEHKENCRAKRRAKKHNGTHVSKYPMRKSNRKIPSRPFPKRVEI